MTRRRELPPPKDPANPSPVYGRTFPAEALRRAEIQAMLSRLEGGSTAAARNRALVILLWRTGLRISEALALRQIDVDLEYQSVRVLHGKGDKARTVAMDRGTVAAVGEWLEARRGWDPPPGAPLFCTRTGARMYSSYVRSMLQRIAREAGIERRVHPHAFRHTFAVELVRERVPVPMIQRLLGHSNLATTTTYLASLSPEEALDAIRRREW